MKNIHIHAKCPFFETWELVPENKAEKRLLDIRKGFERLRDRPLHKENTTRKELSNYRNAMGEEYPKLVVKTVVHNPELPFKH